MRALSTECGSSAREHARANGSNIPPDASPPLRPLCTLAAHSCSSLPACPVRHAADPNPGPNPNPNHAADDAIVIDCMVKGVIPPDCKSERFVSRAAHLLAPGGVIVQWTWREDYQLLSDRWRANFSQVTAQPYPGRAPGGPAVLFVTNVL